MRKLGLIALAGAGIALIVRKARVRALANRALAASRRVLPGGTAYDDPTLKAKVETELFRSEDVSRGSVSVNAQAGVVQLRGEIESPELIEDLVGRTRKVHGVRDVENLLHLPGTPAPMHQ